MKKMMVLLFLLICSSSLLLSCSAATQAYQQPPTVSYTSRMLQAPINEQHNCGTINANTAMMKAMFESFPSLQEAYEQADLVVKLDILSCDSELNQPAAKTLYTANIVQVWKGDHSIEHITVMQDGNSKSNYVDQTMLKPNQQYVLFLKETSNIALENGYWMIGGDTNTYERTDDGHIIKHAYRYEDLADIEVKEQTAHYKKLLQLPKQIQVFTEQSFYERLDQLMK